MAFLYFRAAVTAMAGLFATRVVLRELGDTGYGMYCAVAGVTAVVFFVEGAKQAFRRKASIDYPFRNPDLRESSGECC